MINIYIIVISIIISSIIIITIIISLFNCGRYGTECFAYVR